MEPETATADDQPGASEHAAAPGHVMSAEELTHRVMAIAHDVGVLAGKVLEVSQGVDKLSGDFARHVRLRRHIQL